MKKLKIFLSGLSLVAFTLLIFGSSSLAATCDLTQDNKTACSCPSGYSHPVSGGQIIDNKCDPNKNPVECASGSVDALDKTKCAPLGSDCQTSGGQNLTAENCIKQTPLVKDLNNIVDFLSAAVGVVVIAVIIIGGIQYSLAGGNSTATAAAKKRIMHGLLALLVFILTFAFLQWLIPGGL